MSCNEVNGNSEFFKETSQEKDQKITKFGIF